MPDRVAWLCRKASVWLEHVTGDIRGAVVELALARATGDPTVSLEDLGELVGPEMFDLLGQAFDDPILFDTALHEVGLFGLFLRERGSLLPDDEQLLAASWLTVDRSVHEVVVVNPGAAVTMRNLGTGDVVEVRERSASHQMRVGERYCARIVPDGATNQIIGAIFGVRAGQETAVLDLCAAGDAVELCAWVGALNQVPRLVRRPGLIDEMFDRDAIQAKLESLDEGMDPDGVMNELRAELTRQAHTRWLDEHIPALNGLTPREAAADPTRREQLERLLTEFDPDARQQPGQTRLPDGFEPFSYDVSWLRRELGLG